MEMNIALCCDDRFAIPAMVCLISVFKNNTMHKIHAYILTKSLTQGNIGKFKRLSETYQQEISVRVVNDDRFDAFNISNNRYSKETFFRFLLPDLVDASKALYLDCDTIVRGDLSEFYHTDLKDLACAVVEDCDGDEISKHCRLDMWSDYFNAGVILMNLDYWRENNLCYHLTKFALDNSEICLYNDQDAMNVLLENKVKFVDYRYNFQHRWFFKQRTYSLRKEKWTKVEAASHNPLVLHFCYEIKPWHVECKDPYRDEFLSYATLHEFIGFKLTRKYSRLYVLFSYAISILVSLRYKITGLS